MEPDTNLRQSEVYRGFTIYYAPARRRWLVEFRPGGLLEESNAAFQARRAINVELDGHSVAWPRRGGR